MRIKEFFQGKIEKRSMDNGQIILSGLFCPYNQWSQSIGGYFKEMFQPGAFRTLNDSSEIYCTMNHDMRMILGRRSAGTLTIEDTQEGMRAECRLPNTSYARDLLELVDRGDVKGMSFDFMTISDTWGTDNGIRSRVVKEANLYEVCFTPDPAYLATTIEIEKRSKLLAENPSKTPRLDAARAALAEHYFSAFSK